MPGGAVVITGTADTSRIEAPVTVKAYLMCAFAAFGGIFFGYDTGWMGGVLGMPYFIRQYTGMAYPNVVYPDTGSDAYKAYKKTFHLTARDQSLTTSILSAGTFFGAIIAGDVADFIGRRLTIIMGCFIFSIGCILETASTGLALMTVGRLIAGGGVGFISAIIILYMSEIAPKKVRGALVAGYQFCITIGILLANCVVYATQNRDDTGSYRIPVAIQFLVTLSRRASSRRPPRLLPTCADSQSTPNTSKMSWPKSLPTTSTKCRLFHRPTTLAAGPIASRDPSPTAAATSVVQSSVYSCK